MEEYRDSSFEDTNTGIGEAGTEILRDVSDVTFDGEGEEDAPDTEELNANPGPVQHPHRRRNIIIASAVAAVVVLAGGTGGYVYAASNVQKGMDSALTHAQETDQKLSEKITEAQQLFDGTDEGQVSDAQTLTALSDAIDKAQAQSGVEDTGTNRWLIWQGLDAESGYDADADAAEDVMSQLDQAMTGVIDSVDAKTLADAKAALQQSVDAADQTYADSDGKVQDNATRDALKTALDAAKEVLSDDSVTDAQEYTDQKTAVDNAAKAVTDSVDAKTKADAEAAAAAAASSNASSGGYSGSSSYNGGSYSGGGSGGGYTPSYNGGSPSSSSGSSGGSSSGSYDWQNDYDSMGNPTTPLEGDGWSQDIF